MSKEKERGSAKTNAPTKDSCLGLRLFFEIISNDKYQTKVIFQKIKNIKSL
jgi:hypothetical protein